MTIWLHFEEPIWLSKRTAKIATPQYSLVKTFFFGISYMVVAYGSSVLQKQEVRCWAHTSIQDKSLTLSRN